MAAPPDRPDWRRVLMRAGVCEERAREEACAELNAMSTRDGVERLMHFYNIRYWTIMHVYVFMFWLCEKEPDVARYLVTMAQVNGQYGQSRVAWLMGDACRHGNRAAFHLLLKAGVDKDDWVAMHPLWYIACVGRDPIMARYLVESVGITYTVTPDGIPTFFIAACGSGSLELARYAASLGVGDVNEGPAGGPTALSNACECGSLDIAHFLIEEMGADPLRQAVDVSLMLVYAYNSGNLALIRYIEERTGVQPHTGVLVPHMRALALTHVKLDVLQHLIACGHADLSAQTSTKATVFAYAAKRIDDVRCRVLAEYMLCELTLSDNDIDNACSIAALRSTADTAMLAHARDIQAWNALTREASWTPERHALYPPAFDERVRVLMVGRGRRGCILANMPLELIFMIISSMACRPWYDIDASVPRPFVPSDANKVHGT